MRLYPSGKKVSIIDTQTCHKFSIPLMSHQAGFWSPSNYRRSEEKVMQEVCSHGGMVGVIKIRMHYCICFYTIG